MKLTRCPLALPLIAMPSPTGSCSGAFENCVEAFRGCTPGEIGSLIRSRRNDAADTTRVRLGFGTMVHAPASTSSALTMCSPYRPDRRLPGHGTLFGSIRHFRVRDAHPSFHSLGNVQAGFRRMHDTRCRSNMRVLKRSDRPHRRHAVYRNSHRRSHRSIVRTLSFEPPSSPP